MHYSTGSHVGNANNSVQNTKILTEPIKYHVISGQTSCRNWIDLIHIHFVQLISNLRSTTFMTLINNSVWWRNCTSSYYYMMSNASHFRKYQLQMKVKINDRDYYRDRMDKMSLNQAKSITTACLTRHHKYLKGSVSILVFWTELVALPTCDPVL